MTDGSPDFRRLSDRPIPERMTVVEIEMRELARRFERHAAKSDELIAKLDNRADRQDIAMARLLAGLAILMFVGQLAAPVVLRMIGVPT